MKKLNALTILTLISYSLMAQELSPIVLNKPNFSRGLPVMQALSKRASATEYTTQKLSLQDVSDLLWAANGINRPEVGKRTAPSAMNAQDIEVYAIMEEGVYLYDAPKHTLIPVVKGDHRVHVAGRQVEVAKAPIILLLVSNISKFQRGDESQKLIWAAEDAGIVSQNISLFCASVGLSTRVRASMDLARIKEILKLNDSQHPMLNTPVCYSQAE